MRTCVAEIRELCQVYDIIFLQETWLQGSQLQQLSQIDEQFYRKGNTAMEASSGVLSGRPYGGLAVLWRKSLDTCFPVIYDNETRIIWLELKIHDIK